MGKSGRHGDETEDEKRARRLAKKEAKRARESEQLAGYSNEANPWNDPHLADAFVWGKKIEKVRGLKRAIPALSSLASADVPLSPRPALRPPSALRPRATTRTRRAPRRSRGGVRSS